MARYPSGQGGRRHEPLVDRLKLPYLWLARSKGHIYGYYRRDGRRYRIEGEPGSATFLARYAELHESFEAQATGEPVKGSFAALVIEYKKSPDFRQLASRSQHDYARILERLAERFGPLPVATLPRAFIFKLRDELADKPRTANYTIAVLRKLLSFAVDRGYRPDNPALRPRLLRTEGSHRPWHDAEIERFRQHWPAGTLERVAFELAIHTGQRGGDLVALTRGDYQAGWISLRQAKTRTRVDIPAAPALRAILDPWLASHTAMTLLASRGRTIKVDHFRHVMHRAYQAAGLDGVTTHGLRYTTATLLAELGCDPPTIAAITGHRTLDMVRRYTSRLRRASSAISRLSEKPDGGK